jgi:Spy/CpxP family protein refolding chaperone
MTGRPSRRRGAALAAAAVAVLLAGTPAGAQPPGGRDRVSERVLGARPGADRLAQAVRERLGLNDEQTRRLRDVTGRHAVERQRLLREERTLRRDLRGELARGQDAQQERVGRMLDVLVGLQRRRAELLVAEQRALAEFLTPVQRAEFLALQERAFRAAQQLRAQRDGRPGERPR